MPLLELRKLSKFFGGLAAVLQLDLEVRSQRPSIPELA